MRAFWMFAINDGDGSADNPNRPHFPAGVSVKTTTPGDICYLGTAYGHKHLLLGGLAIPDDNLISEVGEGHTHIVVRIKDAWVQVTRGVTSHQHPINESAGGPIIPDYFMTFVVCSNADVATIASEPGCFPIVEADVSELEDGLQISDLKNAAWTPAQRTTWEARCLDVLGFLLPPQVDRGKRLVLLFLEALLSRHSCNERGLRYTS